ncbi:hypothetical protein [Qipengyuania gaetbuli]|uniref:hypothetical protein n=1 Tax=Qipengyuania gaetbuli TaxID=266952 RepID=UPI001CD6EFCC|nr:hypothetical protein [Qipengyuania gaetbuli]MCA0910966.1 hypothetical protein [Qipengyuania gaetbuli]
MTYESRKIRRKQLPMLAPTTQIALAVLLLSLSSIALYAAVAGWVDRAIFSSTITLLTVALTARSALRSGYDSELDEHDRQMRYYAIATGGVVPVVALAAYTVGLSATDALWRPVSQVEWGAFGMFMLGATIQCAIIAAARKTPAYAADLDEND